MTKFVFCLQLSMKTYYKLILSFWWGWSSISKVSKTASLQSLQYLKNEVRDEVDFLHADKHQSGLPADFNTFSTKASPKVILSLLMSMMKNFQSTQSNKFSNLCNISEKKLGMEYTCCIQINIKVSKSWHYLFWWKQPDISKVSKIGS